MRSFHDHRTAFGEGHIPTECVQSTGPDDEVPNRLNDLILFSGTHHLKLARLACGCLYSSRVMLVGRPTGDEEDAQSWVVGWARTEGKIESVEQPE